MLEYGFVFKQVLLVPESLNLILLVTTYISFYQVLKIFTKEGIYYETSLIFLKMLLCFLNMWCWFRRVQSSLINYYLHFILKKLKQDWVYCKRSVETSWNFLEMWLRFLNLCCGFRRDFIYFYYLLLTFYFTKFWKFSNRKGLIVKH